ncbi:MAG: hypothetical protein RBQ91_01495 [Acholeplasma sp.]|nr:hypothetical protein [Acholeplasma sp.]
MKTLFNERALSVLIILYYGISLIFYYNLFVSTHFKIIEILPVLSIVLFYLFTPFILIYSFVCFLFERSIKRVFYLMLAFLPGLVYSIWFLAMVIKLGESLSNF